MIDLTDKRFCYFIPAEAFVPGNGYRVSIVIENEPGHFPTGNWPYEGKIDQRVPWFWGMTYEAACRIADEQNEKKLGLSKEDVFKILGSSIAAARVPEAPKSRPRTRVKRRSA